MHSIVSIDDSLNALKSLFITDTSRAYSLLSLPFTSDCKTYCKYISNIKDNFICIHMEMKLMRLFTVCYLFPASTDMFFSAMKNYFP